VVDTNKQPLSQASTTASNQRERLLKGLSNRLAYEWKNVYRSLVQNDYDHSGLVSLNRLQQILQEHKVFITNEDSKVIR